MKKLTKSLVALFFAIGVVSCSDSYDIQQKGELLDEITFQTLADLQSYLNGIYDGLEHADEIFLSSALTDELGIAPSNGGNDRTMHRFLFNENNGYAGAIWSRNYRNINRVNRLIVGADEVPANTPAEIAQKNNILGQARAIRAFSYITLLSYFSTDMTNPNALGVMLLEGVPTYGDVAPRVPNQAVYDVIDADITFAVANVTVPAANYKFVTQRMISAMRARYHIYRGQFADAITHATAAGAQLGTQTAYFNMWADSGTGGNELIFALDRPATGRGANIASIYTFNATNLGGSPKFDMGRTLYNDLETIPNDVRLVRFVDASSLIGNYPNDPIPSENDVLIIDKYPGKTNAPLRNDVKVFRTAEMILIRAEALVRQTPNDATARAAAATLVRSIRTARRGATQPAFVYATDQQAIEDILLERKRELCFEGHRYIDIKRLGQLANVSIERDNYDYDGAPGPLTLPVTDHRFTCPIPISELLANPTIVQNPGYN